MMQLRDYQQRAADEVRSWLRRGQFRKCLEAPTGSGKTVIAADLLLDPVRQAVISHRRVLLDQISKTLTRAGVPHGFRASGHKPIPEAPIQLCMIQTELKRNKRQGICKAQIVHVDEIHCQRGPAYTAIFDDYYNDGASILGYTATPSDLGGIVDDVYRVATVPQLITQGYLTQPRVFSCGQPDIRLLEQLRRDAQGEYLAGDVDKIVRPQIIFGQVLKHRKRLSPDSRPFALFAHSVKSSIWWAQSLTSKGVPTAHIDGDDVWVDGKFYKSDSTKRNEVFDRISDLKSEHHLEGVSNRFVLREGWDCSAIGHIIITCPIGRRSSFVQICGRALRPYENREYAIVQDHSGSSITHPRLDSDMPWDWRSPPGLPEKVRIAEFRNDVEPEPIVCPQCMGQRQAGDTCPFCGFRYAKHCRYVIQTDGTLRLVEGRSYPPRTIRPRAGDDKVWESLYFRTVKNGSRTAEQAYAYYAYSNNWRWLPRNLPLMPRAEADWFIPLRDVPRSRLHRKTV